jgi:hypothetical protein
MTDGQALLMVILLCALLSWVIAWAVRLLVMGCERLLGGRKGRVLDGKAKIRQANTP